MSRIKVTIAIIIGVLALTALAGPALLTRAAPATKPMPPVGKHIHDTPVISYYAFSGLITAGKGKGAPVDGSLTLDVHKSGIFTGKFVLTLTGGIAYLNVSGTISGSIVTLNIMQTGAPLIIGQGTFISSTEITGPFQFFESGKLMSTGIWSALKAPGPSSQLSMGFVGHVTSGNDTKMQVNGAIILDATALKPGVTVSGTMNLPDGTVLAVRANVDHSKHIEVNLGVGLHSMHIILVGDPYYNRSSRVGGYQGSFFGPGSHDAGSWVSESFTFATS